MRILITGSTGLLGQALGTRLAPLADVTGLSRHAPRVPTPIRHVVCDLLDVRRTQDVIRDARPQVVIHAQALSDVDQCERDPHLADASNVTTTANVVQAARAVGAWLISVSTDYVFDGAVGRPYDERDATNPVSVYGKSKLEGERVALGYPRSVVVRPSTLFGPGRMNFCDRVVTAANAGQPVPAFVDQVTSPTYTVDLAEALAQFAQRLLVCGGPDDLPSRIFHMANAGCCSRLEFAHRIVDLLGRPRDLVQPIRLADERRAAPRPPFSALTSRYLTEVIGRTLRPWDEALEAYLQ